MTTLESYTRGAWRTGSGDPAILRNPATEEPMAEASSAGVDMGAAVEFARNVGGPALRAMNLVERAGLLKAMAGALGAHRNELLDLAMANGGGTRGDAKFDVDGASGTLAAYASLGRRLGETQVMLDGDPVTLARDTPWSGQHVLLPKPGVAVLINAFNFPAWGFGEKAACALLAGMPVIVKPATSTALVTYRMIQILVTADVLPEGSVQLVCGSAGDLLAHLGEQDVLAFTGSAATALHLKRGENLLARSVSVNVEADSLNSAVLAPGVDPGSDTYELFIRDVVREMTQKTGQKCTAVRKILVPSDHVPRVADDLVAKLESVVVGDPASEGVTMGPLATRQQLEEIRGGIRRLAAEGALLTGGADPVEAVGVPAGKGYFVRPTLMRVDEPDAASDVHTLEVFGPVASVLPYDGEAATACEVVARGRGSLVASAYGDDPTWMRELALGLAPWNGRVYLGSAGVAGVAAGSGMAMPWLLHGGPGRAGNGEELGGLSGLRLYQRRSALQGDQALIQAILGGGTEA